MNTPPKKSTLSAELIVGLFVALVFAGLFVFTVVISGSALFRKNDFTISVVLPDAMGLRRNDPVIARGTSVGIVEDVTFKRDGVHVVAKLNAPVVFYEGYTITVGTTSILGGRQLLLTEGNPNGAQVADVMSLTGIAPANMMDDATAAISDLRSFLAGDFLANLDTISSNIVNITARLDQGEGTLGKLLSADSTLYDNLNAAIENIATIADRIEKGEGTLGHLLSSDTTLYDNLNDTIEDFAAILDRVEKGEGLIGKLLSSDSTLYDNLDSAVTDIATVARRIEQGEGTLGKLLSSDTELYDNLNSTLADIAAIARRLEQGEGTLGKLLTDPGLYDNVNGAVTDVREYMDDMRETTPVSTFSSFIFGAF